MTARMQGPVGVRPLQSGDLDELSAIDAAHAGNVGERAMLGSASVHYYQRSGHSFVAEVRTSTAAGQEASPQVVGFVLAHPSWSGADAVVRVERIAVRSDAAAAEAIASSLTEAVVKSAYDAGVYRLVASVPAADAVARAALRAVQFDEEPQVAYRRQLGSGGLSGAIAASQEHGYEPSEPSRRRA